MKKKTSRRRKQITAASAKNQRGKRKSFPLPPLIDEGVVRAARELDDALRNKQISTEELAKKAAAHRDAVIKQLTAWPVFYDYGIDLTQRPASSFSSFPHYAIDLSRSGMLRLPHCDLFIPNSADWTKYPYLAEEPERYFSSRPGDAGVYSNLTGIPFGEASASGDDGTLSISITRAYGPKGFTVNGWAGINLRPNIQPDLPLTFEVNVDYLWDGYLTWSAFNGQRWDSAWVRGLIEIIAYQEYTTGGRGVTGWSVLWSMSKNLVPKDMQTTIQVYPPFSGDYSFPKEGRLSVLPRLLSKAIGTF